MRIKGRRWPVWIIAIVILVAFGLGLAQDQETLRVSSPVTATDDRFADYVGSLLGTAVTNGDRYRVLRNGDEAYPAMLDAIAGARERVSFESFIYSDGEVSRTFTRALAAAARRGARVRIVLDAFGAADLPEEHRATLERAGVALVWFNTIRPWTLEEANYRTHRKVLVVDGTTAFTGGMGLADHWLGNAESPEHWRDTQFEVTGPAVRALEASFYENWIEAGGMEAPALDPEAPPIPTGARSIVVWSNPTGGASNVKLLYLLSIASARERIDIQSPYFILDESTRWVLDEARKRGVRVRILTDGAITDAKPVKYASRASYAGLLDAGYEIYEFEPTMMHVKAMMVDGAWSVFGSANFDNRSFELNDEMNVAVADRELAAVLTRHFDEDVARSTRLTAAGWRERPWIDRVREGFWSMFGELF